MAIDRRSFVKHLAAGLSLLLPGCRPKASPPAAGGQAEHSGTRALRLQFRHTVSGADERFLLTSLRGEPYWAGPDGVPEATPDWGDYRLDLREAGSAALVHRAGFDSSAALASAPSAAALSMRVPFPSTTLEASVARRRGNAVFQPVWRAMIDPDDAAIDRSPPKLHTRVESVHASGGAARKVDIAIVGDGYRQADFAKFMSDAHRASEYLFSVEPFTTRATDFNVRAVFTPSEEDGVTDPYLGSTKSTAFQCTYGSGITERTLKVGDETALRETASAAPNDFLLVLANARRYGGSSYFGGPAVVSIDSAAAPYLVIHEFAHTFAGLADEYYIPDAAGPTYSGNIEPWNPNVTLSPASLKWGAPTARSRWNKSEYDAYFAGYVRRYFILRQNRVSEERIERFMKDEGRRQNALLARNPRGVAYYEGANGFARGVYRAEVDCIMFSLQTDRFCAACTAAINRVIDHHIS